MPFDYAVHSNLLIHWTGIDIDEKYDRDWHMNDKSTTPCPELKEEYLSRLLNILRHGLWMTTEPELTFKFKSGGTKVTVPEVPRVCFTELRLSHSRTHAKRYGRLSVGVKRPFVFQRGGRPVTYYGPEKHQKHDVFLRSCAKSLTDKSLLHYFKAMNSPGDSSYDFYAESEWRILYTNELTNSGKAIDPRKTSAPEVTEYFMRLSVKEQAKLQYLLPLDGWLSCIIYPSVSVKNKAQQDACIKNAIKTIKENKACHGNLVEGGNWPVEMDLDLCRNL